jgi:hypothetical protein
VHIGPLAKKYGFFTKNVNRRTILKGVFPGFEAPGTSPTRITDLSGTQEGLFEPLLYSTNNL